MYTLSGYSAHADQKELLAWVASMPEKPGRIKLVHGEARAQKALYKAILDFELARHLGIGLAADKRG